MNIAEHVNGLIQASREGIPWHYWLNGFHTLMDGVILSSPAAEVYVQQKKSEHPPFTALVSLTQQLKIYEALAQGYQFEAIPFHKMGIRDAKSLADRFATAVQNLFPVSVHLPLDDLYHLEFQLLKDGEECRFLYTACPRCEGIDSHGYPEITVRQSVDLSDQIKKPGFMYDNRISPNHQDRNTLIKSYETMRDFIEATRMN